MSNGTKRNEIKKCKQRKMVNKINQTTQAIAFSHRTDINRIKSNQIILLNVYPNPSIKEEDF